MKAVICWSGMQGYVAACLRALNTVRGLDLHVFHLDFQDVPAQEELLNGVPNRRLLASAPNTDVSEQVVHLTPDIVFLCGWFYPPYRQLAADARLAGARFVLGMDTPWTGSWQQRVNQLRLRRFISRMQRVVVAGERSAAFARHLGAPETAIVNGLYGFDYTTFRERGGRCLDATAEWPRAFLFAGRYAPEKGLVHLMEAYQRYRAEVADPWPLHCCGSGPEAGLLASEGVTDLGYVLPTALPAVFAAHGVFVMPSLEEPWGVAIGEAAATGLPLICSDACGAAADLLRQHENGVLVPRGDATSLARAMAWMHQRYDRLRELGERSRQLAQPFSAEAWAARMHACFLSAMNEPR